jgi:hypothetical protein
MSQARSERFDMAAGVEEFVFRVAPVSRTVSAGHSGRPEPRAGAEYPNLLGPACVACPERSRWLHSRKACAACPEAVTRAVETHSLN